MYKTVLYSSLVIGKSFQEDIFMNCVRCGSQIVPGAAFCPACGARVSVQNANNQQASSFQQPAGQGQFCQGNQQRYGQPPMGGYPQINTWLVPSILVTVFCCVPFGIVSIIFANKAQTALGFGDLYAAQYNADKAKLWCIIGLVSGVLWGVIWGALALLSEM